MPLCTLVLLPTIRIVQELDQRPNGTERCHSPHGRGFCEPGRAIWFSSNSRGCSWRGAWSFPCPYIHASVRSPILSCILADSKTRTYHGRVGAGWRTAGWPGGAGPGSSGRRPSGSPRRYPSILPPRASKTTVLIVSWGERTKQSLFKPMEEHDNRLTSGLSAGHRPLFVPGC